jgi:hypothetical protein
MMAEHGPGPLQGVLDELELVESAEADEVEAADRLELCGLEDTLKY